MKKYELTSETKVVFGRTLFRIKALVSFGNVSEGDLGGFIEKESNLSHYGNAWVYGNARVYGNAEVYGDARVCGDAWVYGDARVYGNAEVYGNAMVCGDARVYGNAEVCGDARVYGDADYMIVKGLGSQNRSTTVCKDKKLGISVKCGCFFGSLSEFRNKVQETHGDSKYAKEYLALIALIEIHFEVSTEGTK